MIRVGGTEPKEIEVRIIAATNKNIDEMVASRKFREDLYYRLNVVPIHIPPLRERRDDMVPLIFYFLQRFNRIHQKEKSLSPEVVDLFCRHDFPGNIRELANLVERLVVITENDRIETRDLPSSITGHMAKTALPPFLPEGMSLREALDKYETMIIERAMEKYRSQREVARALRVDQATISRKMKKHSGSKLDVILHQ
jgi:transcriptional regulator with PAS, ATPase and Fis domain